MPVNSKITKNKQKEYLFPWKAEDTDISVSRLTKRCNWAFFSQSTAEKELGETDSDQAYFWTKEWQLDEKEIDEDYKKGKILEFSKAKDLLDYLHA